MCVKGNDTFIYSLKLLSDALLIKQVYFLNNIPVKTQQKLGNHLSEKLPNSLHILT